jgi:predicted lipoprotein
MTVSVDGMSSEATIQIGPVVKGNAIRDSLPFVSFKDFTNQLQFADVGKALTALALAAIGADAATLVEGQKVSFTGAMSLNRGSDKILITPISLKAAI